MALPTISCKDLWKTYGAPAPLDSKSTTKTVAALKNVTFDVHPGECFVIMGLSGSGKSTLVRCLTRLIKPSRGEISIEGIDLTSVSDRDLNGIRRRYMAMVFQHFALLPHLTALENVAFPLVIRGVDLQERRKTARELLSTVGLAGREGYYPSELSGGQQQRVGIARALSSDPHILFMDEPFSALDPLLRRELQDEFLRLREKLRKTIVFITHDFDEAVRLADRIAIMRDGEILEIGTPEELLIHSRHPYVMEFTKHADRKAVIRVKSIVRPVPEGLSVSLTVEAGELVSTVAREIMFAKDPVGVVDKGALIGIVMPSDILSVLMGGDHRTGAPQ